MSEILDIDPDEKKTAKGSYAYQSMKYFLYNLAMLGAIMFIAFFYTSIRLNNNISANPNIILAGKILMAIVHAPFIFFSIKGLISFVNSIRYRETYNIAMVIGLLGNGFFLGINLILLNDFVSGILNF